LQLFRSHGCFSDYKINSQTVFKFLHKINMALRPSTSHCRAILRLSAGLRSFLCKINVLFYFVQVTSLKLTPVDGRKILTRRWKSTIRECIDLSLEEIPSQTFPYSNAFLSLPLLSSHFQNQKPLLEVLGFEIIE